MMMMMIDVLDVKTGHRQVEWPAEGHTARKWQSAAAAARKGLWETGHVLKEQLAPPPPACFSGVVRDLLLLSSYSAGNPKRTNSKALVPDSEGGRHRPL